MMKESFLDKQICRYLMKDDNFKRIYAMLQADNNPALTGGYTAGAWDGLGGG